MRKAEKTPEQSGVFYALRGLGQVAGLTLIGISYVIFLLIVLHAMHWVQVPAPQGGKASLAGVPNTFFSLFWYSGLLLNSNFGLHPAALGWAGRVLGAPPVVHLHPLVLNWLYPPTMGLLAMLQGWLPLGFSFFLWRGLYFAISAMLLRRAGLGWGGIIMGLSGPAALLDLSNGENGTLTGGLLVAALMWMETRPLRAGALAGFLCIKPQLGLLLPFILLRRRFFPALAGFVLCVGLLVLLTLPLEGMRAWQWFLTGSRQASTHMISASFAGYFPAIGDTVFFMARSFGASLGVAWAVQALASLAAGGVIWRAWANPVPDALARMGVSVSLAVLVMPYGYLYDLVGFSVAMAALAIRAYGARRLAYAALWLLAGYAGIFAPILGRIFMPVAVVLAAFMAWQELSTPAAPQTPPHAHSPASRR